MDKLAIQTVSWNPPEQVDEYHLPGNRLGTAINASQARIYGLPGAGTDMC